MSDREPSDGRRGALQVSRRSARLLSSGCEGAPAGLFQGDYAERLK